MKFHEHETIYQKNKHWYPGIFKDVSVWEFYDWFIRQVSSIHGNKWSNDPSVNKWITTHTMCAVEGNWYYESRPYYKAWPAITKSLTSIKLDVAMSQLRLPGNPTVLIRFATGHEPTDGDFCVRSILADLGSSEFIDSVDGSRFRQPELRILPILERLTDGRPFESNVYEIFNDKRMDGSLTTIQENIDRYKYIQTLDKAEQVDLRTTIALCFKIAVTVILLANDPTIIQPDVLAADRQRFDESTDPELRQRLIDKARRRGIVGWRIGEQYETIPHFRRPHPALYHVGKGRKEKRIVFRAGAIVHRQKMTQVPTGYIEDDGTEVEP